ncbi:MAG: molybdopterin-guanine dinucleotide biosynthesis protein B [Alphaproteobacteria bacterium]|nr:MAG: molybdopterin-guanine dinucleotide biosynthesis protein B [Alphaproteobacteria bacterium]
MKVFGLAGWSGSGKTTLMRALIPALVGRGLRVSTMKHAHHTFDIDQPGKDSYEHRRAGASEVLITSAKRWALMHELRGAPEPPLEALMQRMTPVDLLLIEGFKRAGHDKLEVHRPALGKPLLCREDPHIVAVASDVPIDGLDVPRLDLNDVEAIATFIVAHCGLSAHPASTGAPASPAAS